MNAYLTANEIRNNEAVRLKFVGVADFMIAFLNQELIDAIDAEDIAGAAAVRKIMSDIEHAIDKPMPKKAPAKPKKLNRSKRDRTSKETQENEQ